MRKRFFSFIIGIFCIALLAGCNEEAKLQKMVPKESDAIAREFITALNQKNVDKAEKLIEPSVRKEAKEKLKSLVELLGKGNPEQVKVIGVRGQAKGDQRLIQLTYQVYFQKAWVVAAIAILETPQSRSIFSVRMDPLREPLEKIYAFKFFGKPFLQYVVLLFSVLIPIFIVYVLVQCLRTPGKKKWIWVPFIILGLATFHLDWTSGRAFIQPISFLIFGAAYMKQKYGPFVVSISVPVGALVFFFVYLFRKPKKVLSPLG